MSKREAVTKLIDRSTLGSPAVRKLRARTSIRRRNQILHKAASRSARVSDGRVTMSEGSSDHGSLPSDSGSKSDQSTGEQMSKKPNVWVTRGDEAWVVRREGSSRASSRHETQREALESARETARREKVELIWQGRDGKIQGRNSYGNDPYPPKG